MDKVGITFYDIVGYTIPGFIGVMSLICFMSTLSEQPEPILLFYKLNIIWQIGLSYIFGHIIQTLVSLFYKNDYIKTLEKLKYDNTLLLNAKNNIAKQLKIKVDSLNHYEILIAENNIISDIINNKLGIFRAFQGLYRGMAGALLICFFEAIALLISNKNYVITYENISYTVSRSTLFVSSISFLFLLIICLMRHASFVRSRLRAVVSFYANKTA